MGKSKNIVIIIGIMIFLALAFFLLIKLNVLNSVISIQGIPEQSQEFNFDGLSGIGKSPYFGTISNAPLQSFCGSNDNDVTISNYITNDGNTLSLSSSISANKQSCGDNNYINAEFDAPKGKITGTYTLSSNAQRGDNGASNSVIKIDNLVYSTHACDPVVGGCNFGSDSKEGTFEIIIDSPKKIKIEITDTASTRGSSSANLELNFIEVEQTYYRFSNNECSQVSIKPSEKTSNDYSTLSDCENNIVQTSTQITVYRLENNICNSYTIEESNKLTSDYQTLSKCEKDIISEAGTKTPKQINTKLITWIAGSLIGIFIIVLIFMFLRRK